MASKSKHVGGNAELDPTMPKTSIEIDGKTYWMCFTFGALATVEAKLLQKGIEVNLLWALDPGNVNLNSVRTLFAASINAAHPEVEWEDALDLVTFDNVFTITNLIFKSLKESVKKSGEEKQAATPTQPGA